MKKVELKEDEILSFKVANHYGGLNLTYDGKSYYWSVENYDGDHWEEIPKYLALALVFAHQRREELRSDF